MDAKTIKAGDTLKMMAHGDPMVVEVLAVRPFHFHYTPALGRVQGTILVKRVDWSSVRLTIPMCQVAELVVDDFPADVKRRLASYRIRKMALEAKDNIRTEADHITAQIKALENQRAELLAELASYPDQDTFEFGTDGELVELLADVPDFVEATGFGLDEMLDLFGVDSTEALK